MAKQEDKILVQYKFALAFRKLLEDNKQAVKNGLADEDIDDSYGKISSSTQLRKATISKVIAGLSEVKCTTIDQILAALGKSYTQFGQVMDALTEDEIMTYKAEKEAERELRKQVKHNKNNPE